MTALHENAGSALQSNDSVQRVPSGSLPPGANATPASTAILTLPVAAKPNTPQAGAMAAGLVSDFVRNVTGNVAYIDAGYHLMA
jgi:hypothetical protein